MVLINKLYYRLKLLKTAIKHYVCLLFLNKNVGNDSYYNSSVHFTGWKNIKIGHNTIIGDDSWLNVNQRVAGFNHIEIGNNCYIGRRNFFSSGKQITVSDYCMTGLDCKLICSDHFIDDPSVPYITTGNSNDKNIHLGVNSWLGAGVIVIGNICIGHGSIIGAGALVNKDVPPFSVVVGNPARVIKRFDFNTISWRPVGEIISEFDLNYPNEEEYLKRLREGFPSITIPVQAATNAFGDLL